MRLPAILVVLSLALCLGFGLTTFAQEEECSEILAIYNREYPIPKPWCGNKLDSSRIAEASKLVRLPDEQTFEDYRIYVLPETREAFLRMAAAAKAEGITLTVESGYRSAAFQRKIIKKRLKVGHPIESILSMVAPPGYSEHQTGRAVDLIPSDASFAKTDIYRWLDENAEKFGFRESYPNDTTNSLHWEPWHWYYFASE